MKSFIIFNSLVFPVIAFDSITLSYFTDENCAFPPPLPFYAALPLSADTDTSGYWGSGVPGFRSFKLNRSMSVNKQFDFSTNTTTACDTFQQSVWNWDTSCRSVNTTTCFKFWINEGFSDGTFGEGWGWNSTSWINITSNNN